MGCELGIRKIHKHIHSRQALNNLQVICNFKSIELEDNYIESLPAFCYFIHIVVESLSASIRKLYIKLGWDIKKFPLNRIIVAILIVLYLIICIHAYSYNLLNM